MALSPLPHTWSVPGLLELLAKLVSQDGGGAHELTAGTPSPLESAG